MSLQVFDLVPAIERVRWSEKIKIVIACLECCDKNVFVGTTESFVIYYSLEEKSYPNGNVVFTPHLRTQSYLEHKKPIVMIKTIPTLNRILLLCDGNLVVLSMVGLEVIPSMSKLKGISCFCVNERRDGRNQFVEICIAKSKRLQIYHVTNEKMLHVRDVPLPETVVTMSMDGQFVCAALKSKYVMVDVDNAYSQELFPHQDGIPPLVKRITEEEFLLVGPSGLGMFVTSAGISERPPLSWGDNILSVAYYHPYLIVLSSTFLTIYSILDQQPKQYIPFRGGCCLDNFNGKIFVASSDVICALLPVPWEKQVQDLLNDKKVTEALEVARYNYKNNSKLSKEQSRKIFQHIQQQAGFIELSLFHFEEAKKLFHEGQLDVREMVSLFPQLMPSTSSFTRTNPPLHNISNVHDMCCMDPGMLVPCFDFLLEYLESIRGTQDSVGYKLEIDTALLKLYAERNSPSLHSFVTMQDMGCNPKDGVQCLLEYERYHALALFHCRLGENDKAAIVWSKLISGEFSDPAFPGLSYFIEFLCKLEDHLLVWKYVDFVLEKDQVNGVKIFIKRDDKTTSERMRPDLIADYLHRYPTAMVLYLEHLVFEKKLEKEKFHTHLAVLYLDSVLQLLKLPETERNGLTEARKKLQQLLHSSSLYRVQLLLGKALDSELHTECAILYGKLEEHEKALRILIHKLQDHAAAEDYCIRMSKGKERKFRHQLFHKLLGLYLDPSMEEDQQEEMLAPAVQLLNSDLAEFDVTKVLQLIPSHWSIAIVDQFLNKALRSTLHRRYCSHIQSALSRGVNLQIRFQKIHLESAPVIMTEDRLCSICKRSFVEPNFVRYPNGIITHPHCAKQHITCPESGRSFVFQNSGDVR